MTYTIMFFAGLIFWKVNSRKFYAVPEEDLLAPCFKKSRGDHKARNRSDGGCNCTEAIRRLGRRREPPR